MSRDPYGGASLSGAGGNRSPRSGRRLGELPTVDRSPSRNYPSAIASRGSPVGRKSGRAGATSPEQHAGYQSMSSPYYGREEEPQSPMMEDRGRAGGHHRSRSATRPPNNPMSVRYQSLDRAGAEPSVHDREFMPIREPRERSLERTAGRDRSLDRGMYLEEELYGSRSARQSPNTHLGRDPGGGYIGELQHQNNDLQRELANLKKELELTNQKLGSSMHSIKTFWSPELKKERALRKEESAKYSLINDQLKLLNSENQVYYKPEFSLDPKRKSPVVWVSFPDLVQSIESHTCRLNNSAQSRRNGQEIPVMLEPHSQSGFNWYIVKQFRSNVS
ncbi:ethionine resistance protein [Homalodisca vitripennis]|nr:ethionine resistance protein [Homalodisca vitripennis]